MTERVLREIYLRGFEIVVKESNPHGFMTSYNPLTLSSSKDATRKFRIEHGRRCLHISEYLARELGQPCVMNIWTGDGFKDVPADRYSPRKRYQESLNAILSEPYDHSLVYPCVESKVFGIGLESDTVGSAEFCRKYAATRADVISLMDNGHYHSTEMLPDKITSLLVFDEKLALRESTKLQP